MWDDHSSSCQVFLQMAAINCLAWGLKIKLRQDCTRSWKTSRCQIHSEWLEGLVCNYCAGRFHSCWKLSRRACLRLYYAIWNQLTLNCATVLTWHKHAVPSDPIPFLDPIAQNTRCDTDCVKTSLVTFSTSSPSTALRTNVFMSSHWTSISRSAHRS